MIEWAAIVVLCAAQSGGVSAPAPATGTEGTRARLADALMREAVLLVSPTDILPIEIEAAVYLSRQSALLIPDEPERWRVVLSISSLAVATLPMAEEASREAISQLARLCPEDEVVRLRRLVDVVERRETVEDRAAAFETLTTPEATKTIGVDIASRLCFDLALLQSRVGNDEAFASNLERALVLSPSFPAAAETAAGFIAERITDPVAEAELLVTAAMANPPEVRLWSRLGALLMQEGAYDAAIRVNKIALACAKTQEAYIEVIDLLVGESALAHWGAGREADALVEVRARLTHNREAFTTLVADMNPGLSRVEAATVEAPISMLLTSIEAALCVVLNAPDAAKFASGVATIAVDQQEMGDARKRQRDARGNKSPDDPAATRRAAGSLVDAATTAAILGGDAAAIEAALAGAKKRGVGDEELAGFAAWKMLSTDPKGAAEQFAMLTVQTPATEYGRARALLATGDRQAAARSFLAIAQGSRGTLIGLLASEQLRLLVGQRLPPSPEVSKLDGVVASIPSTIERYVSNELTAITFRAVPEKRELKPFDPIWYRFTLKNISTMTLAVTPSGPIKQHVLLQPRMLMPGALVVDRLTPEIIPFDRAIELSPNESMTMRWNFAWTGVGYRAVLHPITGVIVEFRGAASYSAEVGGFKVASMGAPAEVGGVEIEGVRVTPEWISSAIEAAARAQTDDDILNIILLGFAIKEKLVPEELRDKAWTAIAEGFDKLSKEAQAWVVFSAPVGVPGVQALLDKVRATDSGLVRMAYLFNYCRTTDDPQLSAAMRSGDPFAMYAAQTVQARFLREAARAEERMRGAKQESVMGAKEAAQQQGTKDSEQKP